MCWSKTPKMHKDLISDPKSIAGDIARMTLDVHVVVRTELIGFLVEVLAQSNQRIWHHIQTWENVCD